MELSSSCRELGEIPIPIPIPINSSSNTKYGGNDHHMNNNTSMHHQVDHHPPHHNVISAPPPSNNGSSMQMQMQMQMQLQAGDDLLLQEDDDHTDEGNKEVVIRYRECLKNHAAGMGGNATDGCGEFMPSGQEGTIEALNCSACNCHRNFHRKQVEGHQLIMQELPPPHHCFINTKFIHNNILTAHPEALGYHHHHTTGILPSRTVLPPPHHMVIGGPLQLIPSQSEQEQTAAAAARVSTTTRKKRFRTKFTQEQKEKMLSFADKVGWKIQKQEESLVQQFCQEIGVRRRVLKVWMHNNKHNLNLANKKQHQPALLN